MAEPHLGRWVNGCFACRRWWALLTITLVAALTACADDGPETARSRSSLSVPVPPEEVAITAHVTRVLGPHALELGDTPALVIVVDGVPSTVRPGAEVQATGSVRTFRKELGTELGIPLGDASLQPFEGADCLVVARLVVPTG